MKPTVNLEIERKYIIMKPDVSVVAEHGEFSSSDIEQIYLSSTPGVTRTLYEPSFITPKFVFVPSLPIIYMTPSGSS